MAQVVENIVWNSTLSTDGATNWNHTTTSNNTQGTFTLSSGKFILFDLTIDSVQIQHESHTATAGHTSVILLEMLDGSNTQLNSEYTAFQQDSDATIVESVRTTSNGSDAWTLDAVNNLRVKLTYVTATGPSATTAYIDHFYAIVTYNVPDPSGGRIFISDGAIKLNTGAIKIIA
jgi:hypothetical protein